MDCDHERARLCCEVWRAHYRVTPHVMLHADATSIDIVMTAVSAARMTSCICATRIVLLSKEGRPDSQRHSSFWCDPVAALHCQILANSDQQVAAVVMPRAREPEGYAAEKHKGNLRVLADGSRETFTTRLGYLDRIGATDHPARSAKGLCV